MDGLENEATGVLLDDHELEDVGALVEGPLLVELPQHGRQLVLLAVDVLDLHSGIIAIILVGILEFPREPRHVPPQPAELHEERLAMVQHVLGEHVLLPVDPQEGERLLRTVEYLRQEAQPRAILIHRLLLTIQHLVRLGELGPVLLGHGVDTKDLVETLEAEEEVAAGSRALVGVKLQLPQPVDLVLALHQVLAHEHSLLESLVAEAALEVLDLLGPLLLGVEDLFLGRGGVSDLS